MRRSVKVASTKALAGAWHMLFWFFIVFGAVWVGLSLKTNAPRAWVYIGKPFVAVKEWASVVGSVSSDVGNLNVLEQKFGEAKLHIDELEVERALLRSENEFLKSQVGVRSRALPIPYVAHLSVRDSFGLSSFASVDLGFHQGVKEFMNVVGMGRVLAGRIATVRENSSQVILLSDPLSRVSARTETAQGVVVGQLSPELIFDLVQKQHVLHEGDIVYTSGLDGIFAPGLPIGRIVRVINNQSDVYQRAFIKPSLDYDRLSEVLIIQGFQ